MVPVSSSVPEGLSSMAYACFIPFCCCVLTNIQGPGWVLIDFLIIGVMMFNVVYALGELAVLYPVSGGFYTYSVRFIDPSWGFAMGWNYVFQVSIEATDVHFRNRRDLLHYPLLTPNSGSSSYRSNLLLLALCVITGKEPEKCTLACGSLFSGLPSPFSTFLELSVSPRKSFGPLA